MATFLITWTMVRTQTFSVFVDAALPPVAEDAAPYLEAWEREDLSPPLPLVQRTVVSVQPVEQKP